MGELVSMESQSDAMSSKDELDIKPARVAQSPVHQNVLRQSVHNRPPTNIPHAMRPRHRNSITVHCYCWEGQTKLGNPKLSIKHVRHVNKKLDATDGWLRKDFHLMGWTCWHWLHEINESSKRLNPQGGFVCDE